MKNYIEQFSALHTNTQKGVKAPHKAIMLLSVIDLVEYEVVTSNMIDFSERLEKQFQQHHREVMVMVNLVSVFKCRIIKFRLFHQLFQVH